MRGMGVGAIFLEGWVVELEQSKVGWLLSGEVPWCSEDNSDSCR